MDQKRLDTNLTRDDPLYKELVVIGRIEKTIRPTALLKYNNLLNSPAVSLRAGKEASPLVRADCASQAIQDAIANIASPTRRDIAGAALGVGKFAGLTIKERLNELPERSLGSFKYQRTLAFEEIVRVLKAPDMGSHTGSTAASNNEPTDQPRRTELALGPVQAGELLGDAYHLHFGGLACLFVWDHTTTESNTAPVSLLSRYLFDKYVPLAWIVANDPLITEPLLPTWASYRLPSLLGVLRKTGPQTISADVFPLYFYTVANRLIMRPAIADRMYRIDWQPWFEVDGAVQVDLIEHVTTMTAVSGALAFVLREEIADNKLGRAKAENLARGFVHDYCASKHVNFTQKMTSKDYKKTLNAYFQQKSAELTKLGLGLII